MSPLLLGAALGGAAMYFFDPDRGRRRRALVRDKTVSASTCVSSFVDAGTRDLKSRGTAVTGRLRSLVGKRKATDDVLIARVRSKMGHHVIHPGAIDVYASEGKVTLNGSILAHEHEELLEGLRQVPGVTDIVDQLAVYETAEGISELQGGRKRPQPGTLSPKTWAPGTQLLAGAAAALFLLRHSSKLRGLLYLAAGAAALARLTPQEQLQHLADTAAPEAFDAPEVSEARRVVEEIS
jgi:osmotically-inducible protein OsmY